MKDSKIIAFCQKIGFFGWLIIIYLVFFVLILIFGPKGNCRDEYDFEDDHEKYCGRWIDVKSEMSSWR